jgi:competence/damage-inducible protein CinA-like protein
MPILEIITIGTELLLGEIVDSNSTYIARTLRDHGIDIYRITTIGDNPKKIAATIQEALKRADIIITTGGLGPTVDDPTRQAVADAAQRKLSFKPELWEQIQERFKRYGRKPTENNRRQAYIPEGAIPVENAVGTAPCYIVEIGSACIISLPGVPKEMEYILHKEIIPYLHEKYTLKSQVIKATVLHASSLGESAIDEIIADLEELSNPTVGLLAHPGQVDIRVTAKASSLEEAQQLSQPIIHEVRSRLGDIIYGQDEETLDGIICDLLTKNQKTLSLIQYGLDGLFDDNIRKCHPDLIPIQTLGLESFDQDRFTEYIKVSRQKNPEITHFGAALILNEQVSLNLVFADSTQIKQETRFYGGPRGYAPLWAKNIGLDFLRRQLITNIGINR